MKDQKIDLSSMKIIIIDDIVTTGASLGSCATQLKIAGASKVIGASVAITYKDKYIPFSKEDRFKPKTK
jgi:predicted amidophosphoribosyltransferase